METISLNKTMKEVFIIAEIAQAHDGDIDVAHQYIDAVAKTGVK